jgi:Flp pilus assembly protein TadD
VQLFKRGLYRPAATELRRSMELDEGNGDVHFYLGETLNQLGEVDEALVVLERAVQYQPDNARAYFTMGLLYDRKHLKDEATAMYRKARDLGPV